jgi:hypothetical protein
LELVDSLVRSHELNEASRKENADIGLPSFKQLLSLDTQETPKLEVTECHQLGVLRGESGGVKTRLIAHAKAARSKTLNTVSSLEGHGVTKRVRSHR